MLANLQAATMGPSQYFTLDAACYYGCKETGAGNCEEICSLPSYQATGTAPSPSPAAKFDPKWLLIGGLAVAALIVVAS